MSDCLDSYYLNNIVGCEKCNSGYIVSDSGKIAYCDCYLKEIIKTKYRNSGIPDVYGKYNCIDDNLIDFCFIKTFGSENCKNILLSDFIKTYKNNFKSLFNDSWNLLIEGSVDSFKTTVSCILGKEYIKNNYSVLFCEMQNLRKIWTGEKLTPQLQKYKEKIDSVDVLILDDFGNEYISYNSDFYMSQLDLLFRDRLSQNKIFIINTNLSQKQIENRYSSRIISLLSNKTIHLKIHSKKDIILDDGVPECML